MLLSRPENGSPVDCNSQADDNFTRDGATEGVVLAERVEPGDYVAGQGLHPVEVLGGPQRRNWGIMVDPLAFRGLLTQTLGPAALSPARGGAGSDRTLSNGSCHEGSTACGDV